MTVQGCGGGEAPDPQQQVYDLLLKISGSMGTAMDQVDGLNQCAASRVSCSDDEINDLTATAKADFSRLQASMRELGSLVNSQEKNALDTSATAPQLKLSGPAPAPHPRAGSSMEVLQALLLQEGELQLEPRKL